MKVLLLCIFSFAVPFVSSTGLNDLYSWNRLGFVWGEDPDNLQSSNATSQTAADDIIPSGISIWESKLFISAPRRNRDVPVTLGFLSLDNPQSLNPLLTPYPSWETNSLTNSEKNDNLVSVYRTYVDQCDRLWFTDTGIIEGRDGSRIIVKDPRIVVIDLKSNAIIKAYTIPQSQLTPGSILTNLVVDVDPANCSDAYAYVPDQKGYGLIVYTLRGDESWRIGHNYFYLEPRNGVFNFSGKLVQLSDGVANLILSEPTLDGSRNLYFQSYAGLNTYRVPTKILQNKRLATYPENEWQEYEYIDKRPENWQASSVDLTDFGLTFLGLPNLNKIGCINTLYSTPHLVGDVTPDQILPYPSDIKVVDEKIYVLTNNLPNYLYGKLNSEDVNFRVWSNDILSAIRGTNCLLYQTSKQERS